MSRKIIECVPNFSEGRSRSIIQGIAQSIRDCEGATLLDVDAGPDFNRTVYTLVGEPDAVLEAAFQCVKKGVELIDMSRQTGEHPRQGAADVVPFIPVENASFEDCVELSHRLGKRLGEELGLPIYLYAKSAQRPDRVRMPDIRKGQYEALEEKMKDPDFAPDYGPQVFLPKSGVTVTGARQFLVAYNINLNTKVKRKAHTIALDIRESGRAKRDENREIVRDEQGIAIKVPGTLPTTQAAGMMYDANTAQVSMNLLDFTKVSLHTAFEEVKRQAAKQEGLEVTGSEIVGVVPKRALLEAAHFHCEDTGKPLPEGEWKQMELAVDYLGLGQLYPFRLEENVIEVMLEKGTVSPKALPPAPPGPLMGLGANEFNEVLASSSPAPGGGSVAALAGSLAAGLTAMVSRLTRGKKYAAVEGTMADRCKEADLLRETLEKKVDEDTDAFHQVMAAFKLPRKSEEEIAAREEAIQEATKGATQVPLSVMELCLEALRFCEYTAEHGNMNSASDSGVGALMAYAGLRGAHLNVKINLADISDRDFCSEIAGKAEVLEIEAAAVHARALAAAEKHIGA
ncbi:MAG: glutamate formimidoyltransferase [Candidatus Krumholzibacteria bacterium]|jgi:glutamate formiminotransferase/formiminotetrahydrofolate cyclodeaminase|nr:glutamate formimidoyltransferase [Candidatus Krumholzibacteria bacterium]